MSPAWGLTITVLLLAVNAFFVAAEFAVTSSRRSQIEPLVEEGKRGAKQAMYALQHVSLMLAICQLGITVMSTSLGVIAEPALAHLLEVPLAALGFSAAAVHAVAFIIALLIVLFLHVVFGEMVPKNISIAASAKALLWLAPPLVSIGRLLRPIVSAMDHMANWFLRLFGIQPSSEIAATFTVDEVENIVKLSQKEGKLQDELGLLSGTLEFSRERAGDAMVPLGDLRTLPVTSTPAEIELAVARTGFSRFPLIDEDRELAGYIHLKDVLYAEGDERDRPVTSWRIRPLETQPVDAEIEDAMKFMQVSGLHMVKVIDDGTVRGVLFLEDILEQLVGEVRDSLQRSSS